MNSSARNADQRLSDAERTLFRRSARELFASRWPREKAVERSLDPEEIAVVWGELAKQGLAALGAETGLREVAVVFEELGRAACPAPFSGAIVVNLALCSPTSNAAQALLQDLHNGLARIALVLGAFDGDPAAGSAELRGNNLHGHVAFVEDAGTATHFAVLTGDRIAVAAADASGITVTATPGMAVPALSEVDFANTPVLFSATPAVSPADLVLVTRLGCASRALGAAQRAFEMAVDHVKVRKQFGQFIGQFQAIQHKLANCLISLDGARLALDAAADAHDRGSDDWRVFASSALAFAGPALRAVSFETHRALGAIGYAEEHEAPRHFRRVHADMTRFGGVRRARAELADYLLGPAQ